MNFNELKLESCLQRGIADRRNTDAVPAEALAKMAKLGSVIDEWAAEALGTLWAGTSIDIDRPYKNGIISSFCRKTSKNPYKKPGNDLLSHSAPGAVPSALKGLTSVFGMGTGVSPSSWLPGLIIGFFVLVNFMVKSHGLLVLVSSIRHRTYTPSLSTS